MTQTLYQGVSHAAWGYFFLYFDVNLGPLNVLPDWAAYLPLESSAGSSGISCCCGPWGLRWRRGTVRTGCCPGRGGAWTASSSRWTC